MPETTKSCSSCGRGNGLDALFCSQCGHRFENVRRYNGLSESRRQCATCGRNLGSFEVHCPTCAANPVSPSKFPAAAQIATAPNFNQNTSQSSTPDLTQGTSNLRQYPANPVAATQSPASPAFYAQPIQPLANPNPHVQCGVCQQWIPQGSTQCQFCGAVFAPMPTSGFPQPGVSFTNPTVQDNRAPVQQVFINTGGAVTPLPPQTQYAMTPYKSKKDKTSAGVLALLLGGFGAHHFYLGNTTAGILSILFFWTYIPALVGMIQGIMYLCMGEEEFQRRYGTNR